MSLVSNVRICIPNSYRSFAIHNSQLTDCALYTPNSINGIRTCFFSNSHTSKPTCSSSKRSIRAIAETLYPVFDSTLDCKARSNNNKHATDSSTLRFWYVVRLPVISDLVMRYVFDLQWVTKVIGQSWSLHEYCIFSWANIHIWFSNKSIYPHGIDI